MAVNNMLKTLAATGLVVASSAYAQEPIAGAGIKATPMSKFTNVSQAMLNNATKDGKNWLLPNGSYDQTRHHRYHKSTLVTCQSCARRLYSRRVLLSRWRQHRSSLTA